MKSFPQQQMEIAHLPIKLGQFLKAANLVQDGLEAKFHILEGKVKVNGAVETRRGRKLIHRDIVSFMGVDHLIVSPAATNE
jgi:ribosome-associated protein